MEIGKGAENNLCSFYHIKNLIAHKKQLQDGSIKARRRGTPEGTRNIIVFARSSPGEATVHWTGVLDCSSLSGISPEGTRNIIVFARSSPGEAPVHWTGAFELFES